VSTDQTLHRAAPRTIGAAALLASAGLYFVNPNSTHVPLCPLHAVTGWWCPLCGATRATWALLHGHWTTALHDNALYVLLLPALMLLWFRWDRLAAAPTNRRLLPRPVFWTVVAVAVAFGVLRNLPLASWLVPPA
jgi:hypothetical protein